jgi:hypothetical protein
MNDRTPMPTPLDSDAVANVLRRRRTTHDFLPERIADDMVERAIEVARWAPNHHRTEPWRFYMLGALARQQIIARSTPNWCASPKVTAPPRSNVNAGLKCRVGC